jgi:hypothetical protein
MDKIREEKLAPLRKKIAELKAENKHGMYAR